MSKKHSRTTCSGMDWNQMNGLLYCLKEDKKWLPYLFIGTGCYLGLRAGDILKLRWCDIADVDELHIIEQKMMMVVDPSMLEAIMNEITKLKQLIQPHNLNIQGKEWMNGDEVMKMLHISSKTLQNYRDRRIIPFTKIGKKIFYNKKEIDKLLNSKATSI